MIAFDMIMSIYQGTLLIFLARKQFIMKPHPYFFEIGCVAVVTLYFSVIQHLQWAIPDSFVIVFLFLYIRLCTNDSMTKCLLYTLLDGFLFAGTLTLVSYLFQIQVDVNGSVIEASNELKIVYSITANTALTVVVNVAARFSKTDDLISYKETIIFIVMLLIEFATSELIFIARTSTKRDTVLVFGSVGAFLVMLLTMVLYEHLTEITRRRRQEEMEQRTLMLVHEHQEEIKIIYKDMLKQQHDLRHRINAVQEILSMQTLGEEARGSVIALLNQPEQTRLFMTGSIAVDAILKSKHATMQNAGISFEFEEYPLMPLPISEQDFCVLLSNLLDNAIEGVMRLPASYPNRNIKLSFSKVWNMLFIKCSNDVDGLHIIRSGEDFVSTKPDSKKHGFGTKSMKRIVENAGGSIEFDISQKSFTVNILIGGDR